ncbi:glycosyltransferase family 4 protein [Kocuria coralli]|uniref:Glycosyltransferase family 4 protein n=1 Tax=Kocuria coralli TaxID=1461025 RepID=A0A5J5KUW9_9MICC|nr:glycosyltransferase family 4 protein [Kocuria coralli]KAA9393322.1 glycosyltransferase family 4 protein [Kocuria coralli]
MTRRQVNFARWRSGTASGGNRYDDRLVRALAAQEVDVREHFQEGPWPVPAEGHRTEFGALLRTERVWLVDNIIASAAPRAIAAAVGECRRVAVLLHYFPADDPSHSPADRARLARTEAASVRAATTVITTSAWAAGEVRRRYGRDVVVATPGVDPAPPARGSTPPSLLWLARLTRTKDPVTFVEALDQLGDRAWTARIVGPHGLDPVLTDHLRQRAAAAGLADGIEITGSREGPGLEAIWHGTDLLVHTAREEAYGMVVSEALSRGVPSIVPEGTGAVEAQRGAGGRFQPGDATALAAVLGAWLDDPGLRRRWRDAALDQRERLPSWEDTAEIIAAAL